MALSSQYPAHASCTRTTTRSRWLQQQDVFQCILDYLAPPEARRAQRSASRRVLVSLAQTCRAFSEPSLDRLWSRLDSLEPLVRCFATVLNEARAKTPPSATEWAIVQRYSHRVRELTIAPPGRISLLFLRSTASHTSLLLPNLRVLGWRITFAKAQSSLSITLIRQLLSPSLVSLNVTLGDADDPASQSFLANYSSLCPNLESLTISVAGRKHVSKTTVGILSRAIPHYGHLECLDVSSLIDHVALTHLATSPKFKRLALVLHPDASSLHHVSIPSDVTPFRNVEELSLEVWDFRFVTALLRTRDQMFRSFVLRHHSPPPIDATCALLTALASPQRTRSLRSVRLTPVMPVYAETFHLDTLHLAAGEPDGFATRHHLTYDTLLPLTSLNHLRELIIDLGRLFSIDDDELTALARNWPSLHVLHLNCKHDTHRHPTRVATKLKQVTFKGLTSLLACCPDLRTFYVPLDAKQLLVNLRTRIGGTPLTYILCPAIPRIVLACWKKS